MDLSKEIEFKTELAGLINKLSLENDSDTPDFIIAEYLFRALKNYNETVATRTKWWSPVPKELIEEAKFNAANGQPV